MDWAELLAQHGTITLVAALAPAIGYARDGFPVSEIIATQWKGAPKLARDPAAAAPSCRTAAPRPGEVFKNPHLAPHLQQIAAGGRDAFYSGPVAAAIVADLQKRQGLLDERDFAEHHSDWVDPISDDLSRLRGLRAAAEHAGVHGARDAEHPRGVRPEGARPQLGGLPASARRGEPHRLCRPRRLPGRSRVVPAAVQPMLISKEYAATRRKEIYPPHAAAATYPAGDGSARRQGRSGARPASNSTTRRHHLPDGGRRQGQRRLAHRVALRRVRRGHRRRRHRHRAAEPRHPLHAGGRPSRTRSRRASGRFTRSCPRWCMKDGQAVAVVRRHGRRHAAAGPRAGAART